MNKNYLLLLVVSMLLLSCSTGKKALQKGDYFSAVSRAVERLKSAPDNQKARKVLKDGYPMAIEWAQEEMDFTLSANEVFKWENALEMMNQVNRLSELIRSTPAAREIIPNPKSYTSELSLAHEKAAEERFQAGNNLLKQNTREAARDAFNHFSRADQLVPGYKNVNEQLNQAKKMATLNVVVEAITVHTKQYELSSAFFYDKVFEYLNNRYPRKSFVNIYSPKEAETFGIEYPDYIVNLEFFDFSVGNLVRHEKEEELLKRVKIETRDTTKVEYKTYKAKLKIYTDEVISGGRLEYRLIDFRENTLLRNKLIPGKFTWVNRYAIYAGDSEALSKEQFQLTQNKVLPLPPHQDLFIEFTRPIYDELVQELDYFFSRHK